MTNQRKNLQLKIGKLTKQLDFLKHIEDVFSDLPIYLVHDDFLYGKSGHIQFKEEDISFHDLVDKLPPLDAVTFSNTYLYTLPKDLLEGSSKWCDHPFTREFLFTLCIENHTPSISWFTKTDHGIFEVTLDLKHILRSVAIETSRRNFEWSLSRALKSSNTRKTVFDTNKPKNGQEFRQETHYYSSYDEISQEDIFM